MLKLKKYSFSGIGRFVEKQTVDFEGRDSLIQIDGENTNTGGSSGAGKSTTVEALAYLLGISDISATQLQSRITKSPIYVRGEFEGGITITRSKKDGLTIETPEGTVSGNSKLAEEKLDEIIGVSRKLLKTMCYKRQKQGGFFLNLTPKESHNFLVEVLNLKEYQSKIFKLEDILKTQYKPRKIQLTSSIQVRSENISSLKSLLEEKKLPLRPETAYLPEQENRLLVVKADMKNVMSVFEESKAKHGPKPVEKILEGFKKQEELEGYILTSKDLRDVMNSNDINHQQEVNKTLTAKNAIVMKLKECEDAQERVVVLKQKLSELVQEKTHLDGGKCNTCLRDWEVGEETIAGLMVKIEEVNKQITANSELKDKIPTYLEMLRKIELIVTEKQSKAVNEEEKKQMESLDEKIRVLKNEKENLASVANQAYLQELTKWQEGFSLIEKVFQQKSLEGSNEIHSLESEISKTQSALAAYETAKATFATDSNNLSAKIKEASEELIKEDEEIKQLDKDILLSEESIRLIKNFTLQKFQDTLEYIGDRATEIINNVPNMSSAVVYFDNAKETKSGNIKNEVNAVINLEGDVGIPIKTLSGGERTSADFAIDLAVSEMIESMTKKGVNFLIIDEGFDGLDSISKIECLEILNNLNTDKKILIVDHSSEVKEMVSDIIKVRRTNEVSVLV